MKEIEINEQQKNFLVEILSEIADNNYVLNVGDQKYSRSYSIIAQQIINKLEE